MVRAIGTGMRETSAPLMAISLNSHSPLARSPGVPTLWMPLASNAAIRCTAQDVVRRDMYN
jgi:hypothetical protein